MDKKMSNLPRDSRHVEEKHLFSYRKLVVPLSMRSMYWKYFGFPANEEEEILTKIKIVCTLCKMQIAYNRNTSNLRMHLQNKHLTHLQQLEENAPEKPSSKVKQERDLEKLRRKRERLGLIKSNNSNSHISLHSHLMGGTMSLDGEVEYITETPLQMENDNDDDDDMEWEGKTLVLIPNSKPKNSIPVADEVDGSVYNLDKDAVLEFMIVDLEPGYIIEGKGFQALIATLRSPCEIPNKDRMEEFLIPRAYSAFKDLTRNTIANLTGNTGLIVEEWIHSHGEAYVTVYLYYQMQVDDALEFKVLSTVHCSEYTDWKAVIDQLVCEWELKTEKVTAVVVGSSRTRIFEAFREKGFVTIPCVLHTLQVCARLLFEQREVAKVLSRIRCMIGMISRSPAASTALQLQLRINGQSQNEEAMLKMDYPRVWASTYNMLDTFRSLKDAIETIMNNIEGVTMSTKQAVWLSSEEWQIVDDLVTVLAPFKVTMLTLGEEKSPLISLLKPLLSQLTGSHLKRSTKDSESVISFKDMLAEQLETTYADFDVNLMLQTAMALDPRFKQLPYASEEDKKNVTTSIKTQLDKLVAKSKIVRDLPELPKKSKLSGLQFILGGLCTPQTVNLRADKGLSELTQYASEAVASLEDSPLVWWARASDRFPNLARLAQKYTCVPSLCIPVSRVPAEAQVLFDHKRARIAPEMIEKLLFLNGNFATS